MPPPVAVYVVAAVGIVATAFLFKEYVYEPHIAPKIEEWAEEFLARRRANRSRRASAVPVGASRGRRDTSSDGSHHSYDHLREEGENDRALEPGAFAADGFELEALASREVDEWRNEVLRSQGQTRVGLRKRRTGPFKDEFDGFDTSMTLDESFTSLTHTPLASTHVISNLSSPITPSTVSLPLTPTGRLRSGSQSTTTPGDANITLTTEPSQPSIPDMSIMTPVVASSGPMPHPVMGDAGHFDIASPPPIVIPDTVPRSSIADVTLHPLSFTPTYEVAADDSPFGPLLPDTPRSSAEIYGERPFSPITRVMGSSSGYVSAAGSRGTLPSRANSTSSLRTLGSSGVLRRGSGLANEVVANELDDDSDNHDPPHTSTPTLTQANIDVGMNASTISSLSERYPAPLTPPVVVSPPTSSIGIISPPSSPGSGESGVVVHHDTLSETHSHISLPSLRVPSDSSNGRLVSAASISPALSWSESEGDEFLSVASDYSDSEWRTPPVHDHPHNPFLDFELEQADGSEGTGSDVLVSEHGHEGASEVDSDESWGEIGR